MRPDYFKIVRFILLLAVGVALIWLSLRKISFSALWAELEQGDYRVCIPVLAVSALGYLFRVLRWKLMLRMMGEDCRVSSLYASLCMGYAVSFVVPRLGEFTRALVIRRTDRVKVDFSLLSIVAERFMDTLMLLMFASVAMVVWSGWFSELIDVKHSLPGRMLSSEYIGLAVLILIALLALGWYLIRGKDWFRAFVTRYKPALSGLVRSTVKGSFWMYTGLIWLCYFLMTYLWFGLFDAAATLTWTDAFLVMVVGSFGRSVPVQGGGMGVYHFLVSRLFVLLGLELVTGNALALVIHGAQAVFTFVMGVLSYAWMLADKGRHPDKIKGDGDR